MPKIDLIQKSDVKFARQMQLFKESIAPFAATFDLTPEQVAAQAADADYFTHIIECQQLLRNSAKTLTGLRKNARRGSGPGEMPLPTFPAAVPPVAQGVEQRFRKLVQQIKAKTHYTEAIGIQLGIEALAPTAPDFTALQPVLTLLLLGDGVQLSWSWQGFSAFLDQCELQVDRGDGRGFGLLTHGTRTRYVDATPFPAVPARWQYRAIYHAADERVGNWSNTVSIGVPP